MLDIYLISRLLFPLWFLLCFPLSSCSFNSLKEYFEISSSVWFSSILFNFVLSLIKFLLMLCWVLVCVLWVWCVLYILWYSVADYGKICFSVYFLFWCMPFFYFLLDFSCFYTVLVWITSGPCFSSFGWFQSFLSLGSPLLCWFTSLGSLTGSLTGRGGRLMETFGVVAKICSRKWIWWLLFLLFWDASLCVGRLRSVRVA